MTGGDEMRQKQDKPTLNFKKLEDKKKVAELLLDGYSQEDIGKHFGYAPSTISILLLRAGGTDRFIEETIGTNAVEQYRAHQSNQRREFGSAGGRARHDKDLTTDVAEDLSIGSSRKRSDDLGTPEREPRSIGPSQGLRTLPSRGYVEKKVKAFRSACERAAVTGKHKVEVQRLMNSFTESVLKGDAAKSLVPVIVSSYESLKTGSVLVLRVKRLTKTEAEQAGDDGKKIDEFIGTLVREINRANEPDSTLGAAFRAHNFKQVLLQTSMMGAPVQLLVKDLS